MSAASAGFAQNRAEVSSAKAETLFDYSCYCDAGAAAGNAVLVAEHPEMSGTVVDFKGAHAHNCERIYYPADEGYFSVVKTSGISINRLDALTGRARGQQQSSDGQQGGAGDSGR